MDKGKDKVICNRAGTEEMSNSKEGTVKSTDQPPKGCEFESTKTVVLFDEN
jgi:uncharacterized phage protein gp47/JayE